MFEFQTSHQIAADGPFRKIYRLFKDGEHVIDASYAGGQYIDLGTYHDFSTEYVPNWNRIEAEPGTFTTRDVVNVLNNETDEADISNTVEEVEAAVFADMFGTECSHCNADVDESETDNSGRCQDCQDNLCEYCEDAVTPEGVENCDECEKFLSEN